MPSLKSHIYRKYVTNYNIIINLNMSTNTTAAKPKAKTAKPQKQVKLPLSDVDKKMVLEVVLKTPNISFEEAKIKYVNGLQQLIEQINECTDEKAFKKIIKNEPKLVTFDYDKAITDLIDKNIIITKKDLKKYVQLL